MNANILFFKGIRQIKKNTICFEFQLKKTKTNKTYAIKTIINYIFSYGNSFNNNA
jgi:hypothetical protein